MATAAKKKVVKKPNRKSSPYFTAKDSVRVVQDRSGLKADKRAKELVDSLVKHLHAFVKETKPTLDEWMYGINFLTRTGHLSTDWRQEFILSLFRVSTSMEMPSTSDSKIYSCRQSVHR